MSGNGGRRATSSKRFAKKPARGTRKASRSRSRSSNGMSSNTMRAVKANVKAGTAMVGTVLKKHGGGVYDVQVGVSSMRLRARGAIQNKRIDVGSHVVVKDREIHSVISKMQAAQLRGSSSNSLFEY